MSSSIRRSSWKRLRSDALTTSGAAVTADRAMRVAAVYACVRIRSGVVANMPIHIKRRIDDRTRDDASDLPLWRILRRKPNGWQTAAQFKRMMQAHLAADNTPAAIDLQGYNAAEIALAIGVGGITFSATNKIEFVVTHSDNGATCENVENKDILGVSGISGGIVKALTSAHAAADCSRFGYVGGKRYLKILADFSGTHGTGTPVAAMVIKGYGHDNPQAHQA